ncbi:MAG TPA: amidase [Burkholderiales bacterium]|nr:amidase [Burkholderiales bacterium]
MSGYRLAVKDNIDVAGLPTTAGLQAWRNRIAQHDAPIVAALRKAGAVIVGKTLMDEAAFGALGDNPWYGRVHNPARHGYTAGGSSAGSAAAVASGLADLALGTDTLGSVRIPASYCGVVGYVPSANSIPMEGVVPLAPSFDRVGFLTRTVREMVTLTGTKEESSAYSVKAITSLPFIEHAAERLRGAGCRIETIDPAFNWGALRRAMLLQIEIEAAPLLWLESLSAPLRAALEFGKNAGPDRRRKAETIMQAARNTIRSWMGDSLLLLPSTPGPAFPFDTPVPADQADYVTLSSLLGLPAVSVPAPVAPGELPIGLQLIAPLGKDAPLLTTAALLGR